MCKYAPFISAHKVQKPLYLDTNAFDKYLFPYFHLTGINSSWMLQWPVSAAEVVLSMVGIDLWEQMCEWAKQSELVEWACTK